MQVLHAIAMQDIPVAATSTQEHTPIAPRVARASIATRLSPPRRRRRQRARTAARASTRMRPGVHVFHTQLALDLRAICGADVWRSDLHVHRSECQLFAALVSIIVVAPAHGLYGGNLTKLLCRGTARGHGDDF